MDVRVVEQQGQGDIEVTIRCAPGDERAARLAERIRASQGRLAGYEGGGLTQRLVSIDQVSCVAFENQRAWLCLTDGTRLESPLRLFELEEALDGTEFVRASRQDLVNFDHVRAIRPEPGSRLMLTLDGGRRVLATRTYTPGIKKKIGIRR
ncbi:LytTR family DNA-binding domain-containing protein [Olsenella sp. HMSC062G07]|uniref:LytTR family DNA-binding domain-containing protein n=1 Tax=Olsenella sp. HMSC062G07 TaxID=1739330 RepID=UPI0008A492D8|nr:LytTR family DNA-binding domain-containing protein [Olsenella sp. HMSC062G07]OFK22830.1 hypothetical protein HMPREF2826_00930 [Olsenella sp. HMSC062G07]